MTDGQRLGVAKFALGYGAALVAMLVCDGFFLGVIAENFYQQEMGSLMAPHVRVGAAAVFYLLFPAALVYLVMQVRPSGWREVLLRSAVLGLAAYGAYDLTNLAIVRDWSLKLSLVDWLWGAVICSIAGAAAYAATWARAPADA